MAEHLWSMFFDCGRQGNVEGLFIASDKDVAALEGWTMRLDEPLGKHSYFEHTFKKKDQSIKKIDIGTDAVLELKKAFRSTELSGYNPLLYVEKFEDND